ncbi:hypothetical protein CPB84DRAFT_1846786 [Gymnopilus junonius]|uniref:Uncharacterized protein n=1 Tax=Gymnopilus junonius TaxID=109634 RepID=A0A9P5TMQ2_GYMJU|nr:hypothetical protein CPB84DRAFT_1846786 [Gymnopilus junonius]
MATRTHIVPRQKVLHHPQQLLVLPLHNLLDMVASRPPSPLVQVEKETIPSVIDCGSIHVQNNVVDSVINKELSKSFDSEDDSDWNEWTPVRRRAHSLEPPSVRKPKKEFIIKNKIPKVPKELTFTIKEAEKSLTTSQQEQIARRNAKIVQPHQEHDESIGAGPSNPKGKGVDP